MNRVLTCLCACATAIGATFALSAQEEGADGAAKTETANTETAEAELDPALVKAAAKPAAKFFHALVRLSVANGEVQVRLPKEKTFVKAVEGKFYPTGSHFRTAGGSAEFEFGKEAVLKVADDSEFGVSESDISSQQRTAIPIRGTFTMSLPRTMPTGAFSLAFPNFTAKDLAGESRYELTPSGDGDEVVVHVITGMLTIDGPHYKVLRMSAADRMRIRTTGDTLFTSLRGEAGDCKVSLDQGCTTYKDPISGEVKKQDRRLDFSLTPQCAIKIFRKRSQVGGRMAVSVMTFDPAGEMRNRFTFAEGAANVNFGEEVVRIQDISFKTDKKAGGKKASEDGKAEEGAKEGEAGSGESSSSESGSGESSSGESSSGGSGSGESGSGESSSNSGGGFGA